MARNDALLRLHERLLVQRDRLRQKLSENVTELGEDVGGDTGDLAFHDSERELETQLFSLESRELVRIEKALEAIRNGTYGFCDRCESRIPIARLQALPHTSSCVNCQRKSENRQGAAGTEPNWESAWEFQAGESDRDLTLRDLHLETD